MYPQILRNIQYLEFGSVPYKTLLCVFSMKSAIEMSQKVSEKCFNYFDQVSSVTNVTSFESPNIELFKESGKKLEKHYFH